MIRALEKALEGRADYYDVRYTNVTSTNLEMKNKDVTRAIAGSEEGACVRVLYRGAWGFASTSELTERSLVDTADRAARMARGISESIKIRSSLAPVEPARDEVEVPMRKSFLDMSIEEKLALLVSTYDALKDYDFINNMTATYKDFFTLEELMSSEGAHVVTKTPRILWSVEIVGRKDGDIQSVRRRIGSTTGFEVFDGEKNVTVARDGAASLVALLAGKSPPSGPLPVIADNGLCGVFAHEAVGHASEGDLVATGNSCFEGLVGKPIGNEIVTIKDDATIPGLFGSFIYDAEGVRTRTKVLVKDGVLNDLILSRETAARLGMEPNGGARAESYHYRPIVRMSNTYIDMGDASFREMLEGIKLGVYAKDSRGGQVNTSQGLFQFNAQEAYLIENGEITKPLRDVSLSGKTLDILKQIDMVGKDLMLGHPGICGKGQSAPVGDGGPHIRIAKCVVGGR
ncbi:peptidase U62 family protein [Methanocella paludicola SANAE]|uniref:Peptidase U62 family protein n=1 Tax=Methanocella paludicola (strain DSM 17711 / JCM 13418 / NBRC 101707 / SANAE) TaxID=304371 RepID=D1YXC5_METPS|nr:TldD/PmbA family protein [Methanocella paludicola]BAI61097.1 peptidase U62 family protein [Methanocella paludicola SANAE]